MSSRFADRVALITGGGSGIGAAVALAFAREGAAVVVAGRRSDPLEHTVKLIQDEGGRAAAVTADVGREEDAARLVAETADRFGGLHIAVNNAGTTGRPGLLADMDLATWSAVHSTNVTGTWLSMKHEISHMRRHGGGVIVNMASVIGAHLTFPAMGAYASSKAAVSVLTRTAAKEYIADGIRINAVSPGPLDTPMSLLPGETQADRAERMRTALPIGRVGSLDEAAATVLWLASPESGFVVGHDILLDGGAAA